MTRKGPNLPTDEAAEEFLSQDLSDLDFSQFKPLQINFAADVPAGGQATMAHGSDSLRRATGAPPTPDPSPQGGGRGRSRDAGD